jgi:plastocyanin
VKHWSKTRAKHPRRIPVVTAAICVTAILAIGVFVVGCGGTTATTTAGGGVITTAAGGTQVALKNFAYDPANVTIKAGGSVTWTNQDSVTHDVTADNGEFKSGSLANGATFSFTFAKAGTYPYHCGIHPTMKGTITVQ